MIPVKKHLIKLLIVFLAIVYLITGIVFLSTKNAGGIILGLSFFGGSALLYLATEAVRRLHNIEQLLIIAVTEPVENQETKRIPVNTELENQSEVPPTDTDKLINISNSTKPRKMRG